MEARPASTPPSTAKAQPLSNVCSKEKMEQRRRRNLSMWHYVWEEVWLHIRQLHGQPIVVEKSETLCLCESHPPDRLLGGDPRKLLPTFTVFLQLTHEGSMYGKQGESSISNALTVRGMYIFTFPLNISVVPLTIYMLVPTFY